MNWKYWSTAVTSEQCWSKLVCYLQADVSVAVLQHGDDLAVRQTVHRLTVDTDDPVPHLSSTHTRVSVMCAVTVCRVISQSPSLP